MPIRIRTVRATRDTSRTCEGSPKAGALRMRMTRFNPNVTVRSFTSLEHDETPIGKNFRDPPRIAKRLNTKYLEARAC